MSFLCVVSLFAVSPAFLNTTDRPNVMNIFSDFFAKFDDICVKFTGWRMRSYPIEIFAGEELIWSGETPQSLGYVHLPVKPVTTREITLRLKGSATEQDAFSGIVEVVAPAAGELDLFKAKGAGEPNNELRIVEIEFKENLLQ